MNILDLTFDQLRDGKRLSTQCLRELRHAYRAILQGKIVPLPEWLAADCNADVSPVVREQRDGDLVKFVQKQADGLETESVIVPMQRRGKAWNSLCVSSQIGCARGCTFCETAQLGLLRQLTPAEIVGQVVAAQRFFGVKIRNVVFMGMGEPLDNFDNVIQAVRVLTDTSGLSLGKGSIRISTVGRADGIRRLAELGWHRLNLAVSLNAPNDEIRSAIMPINRNEPMSVLREAMAAYPLRNCSFIMVEYVLIPGINDERSHAEELAEYLRPIKSCVNVIPYNPRSDSPYAAPKQEDVAQFLAWLKQAGQYCKQRVTKGREHMAACGQLGNRDLARRRTRAEK